MAWKDLPDTECINRNRYDYGETDLDPPTTTPVEDILEIFKQIHKLKNRFSAANAQQLLGDLIKHYKVLNYVQKNIVLTNWAREYYVDRSALKEKMNQSIDDFKSLAATVNDLKNVIEPQYMWIFRKMSNVIGGQEMIQNIKDEILRIFLQCPGMSFFQKLALSELRDNLKSIDSVKCEVIFSRYVTID